MRRRARRWARSRRLADHGTRPEQSSETWRRLRKRERRNINEGTCSRRPPLPARHRRRSGTEIPARDTDARGYSANLSRDHATGVSAAGYSIGHQFIASFSTERLRDYVGAFVLAGLDQHVGAEADFLPIASSTTTKG